MNKKWIDVNKCPACNSYDFADKGNILRKEYFFGNEIIPCPVIAVVECSTCSLLFKRTVPSPKFLSEIFSRQVDNVWNDDYNFIFESRLIKKYVNKLAFDLLDVGASNGLLLKSISDLSGRRSGLDVVQHAGLEKYLRGEFICEFIDEEKLNWSGEKYDAITVYDVFEHLYNPSNAFRNLNAMLKKEGIVVIETGNISICKNPCVWWYVNLFEHHIFWQPKSILYHTQRSGFEVIMMKHVVHKNWKEKTVVCKLKQMIKLFLWTFLPKSKYAKLAKSMNKDSFCDGLFKPWLHFDKDHFMVILKKV